MIVCGCRCQPTVLFRIATNTFNEIKKRAAILTLLNLSRVFIVFPFWFRKTPARLKVQFLGFIPTHRHSKGMLSYPLTRIYGHPKDPGSYYPSDRLNQRSPDNPRINELKTANVQAN